MHLVLLVGPARLPDLASAEHYADVVTGTCSVAADYPFAAWAEPEDAPAHVGRVDGPVVAALRLAAARWATSGEVPGDGPADESALFHDPVLGAVWERGPEHTAARGRLGAPPGITGTGRLDAFDHFLHHSGEPVVCSPVDFAPVVRDNRAPGGVVPSASRLIAEARHLAGVLALPPDDPRAAGIRALVAAAGAALAAGAGLVLDYA
ncbi:hypothetical protein ABZ816_25635 [Actinosynnema sp. NPDC047251]|uniref:Putative membrane protein n=1 Tax=Saccharothrix espanaensis (strain ATCC 51144 / DSM 44229 / JCM 9112 / NBRC 15066 / NRRL 15764) TaxID=1179773 RepID=K0K5G0_SACES|nr:hypothetical protein [Saccharothrix espanaensis]CCH31788.1 putative membrane protein [Saccharothrix espanaensis DSM 44229]